MNTQLQNINEGKAMKRVGKISELSNQTQVDLKHQENRAWKANNDKQSKERSMKQINNLAIKDEWSLQDEQQLFLLHNQLGNRWASIGLKLGNRSDNCVKNHFYSKLRRGLRKINRVVSTVYIPQISQFKPSILYKIAEVAEEGFKQQSLYQSNFLKFSLELRNRLFQFSYGEDVREDVNNLLSGIDVDQAKSIIEMLIEFTLNYKRKVKKNKKGKINKKIPDFRQSLKTLDFQGIENQQNGLNHSQKSKSHSRQRRYSEETISSEFLAQIQTRSRRSQHLLTIFQKQERGQANESRQDIDWMQEGFFIDKNGNKQEQTLKNEVSYFLEESEFCGTPFPQIGLVYHRWSFEDNLFLI